jgi:glutamine amidotransferase PdxT
MRLVWLYDIKAHILKTVGSQLVVKLSANTLTTSFHPQKNNNTHFVMTVILTSYDCCEIFELCFY